jgi:hypothetical protein
MEPAKKGEVLCSHCSLIAHSKCAGRAALTCDLRSKLLIHAQFAERGSSPAEFFTRLPNHHPASASSSRGSFERERANSPTSSSPHPPVAYKVLSPFKRSRASITPDPTQSNSSVSLAALPPKVIPEGNIIRRKLSIILTRQREPAQRERARPLSVSSIGSSSPASQSPQSNSLRSLQAAAVAASAIRVLICPHRRQRRRLRRSLTLLLLLPLRLMTPARLVSLCRILLRRRRRKG